MCSDTPDSSMPLIKFARKLAETVTEKQSRAELESQDMAQDEDKELVCDARSACLSLNVVVSRWMVFALLVWSMNHPEYLHL
jgi:hypothetical protein